MCVPVFFGSKEILLQFALCLAKLWQNFDTAVFFKPDYHKWTLHTVVGEFCICSLVQVYLQVFIDVFSSKRDTSF